jgi:Reverse transcriptase (RNA-dependent DNA polymerase)
MSVLSYQDLPKPVYSHAPSPEHFVYDPDWFNSIEEQQAYLEQKAFKEELARNRPVQSWSQEDWEYYWRLAEAFKQATGLKWGKSDDPWVQDFMETYRPNLSFQQEPSPPAQPQEGLSSLQPRHSSHARQPVVCPDNIYGNQNPIESEQMSNQRFQRLMEGIPAPSGSSNRPESPPYEGKGKKCANYLAQIMQEEGAGLINFLLSNAIKPTDGAGGKLPDVYDVHEWHYRDLMRFPEAARKEWKTAYLEELESLQKRNVFKLTNPPKGCKMIGCWWVFDINSDGQKKAQLVAQGFSQVEGLDYNELFSPVVWFESMREIFALTALNGWYMTGVDVHTAYLYSKLDEEIYMCQPEGFITKGQENKVICLQWALYVLKQAGLAW